MLADHTASGQALGYYFQLERALSWISQMPADSVVGIETEDDIVVSLLNGEKILEQDKSSTTTHPFIPSRVDLWKTLFIWIDALSNKEIEIASTTFFLVTNKTATNSIAEQLGSSTSSKEIADSIALLKEKAAAVSGDAKTYADKVLAFGDTLLSQLITKIRYKAGSGLYGEALRKQLYSDLQLDVSNNAVNDAVITQLLGWLFLQVTEAWRDKRPALIGRNEFMREKLTILAFHRQKILDEVIVELGKIPQPEEKQQWNSNYVKQLQEIECDADEIIGAIHDYLNAVAKRTNMAMAGYLTYPQLDQLDQSLQNRWENIFKLIQLKHKKDTDIEKGKICLYETMQCDTAIGEYPLRNHFVTRGSYHALSNELKVGWHPQYKILLKQLSMAKETSTDA